MKEIEMKNKSLIVLLVLGVSMITASISFAADAPVTLMTYSQGDNRLGLDTQPNKNPLKIAGKEIAKGISTSTAVLEFELEQEFKSLSVDIGITDGATGAGMFYILLDGAIAHQSAQTPSQEAKTIELPCTGVGNVTLAAHVAAGDHNRAIWGNVRVMTADGKAVYLSDIIKQQKKLHFNSYHRLLGRVDPEPETKTISEAKGQKRIESDWIMQAEGQCLGERALAEIGWTRKLAKRVIEKTTSGTERNKTKAKVDSELAKLVDIEKRLSETVDLGTSSNCTALAYILGTSVFPDHDISIPVENGIYKIQFLLYEGWGANGRKIDISIESNSVVKNYFCWQEQGSTSDHGSLVTTAVEIKDGQIDISVKASIPPNMGCHLPGLIISKAKSVAPVTTSVLDNPKKLDTTNVVKAINFGHTGNQTIAGVTFMASGGNSTVDGVKNTAPNAIGLQSNGQTIPRISPTSKKKLFAYRDDYVTVRQIKRAIMMLHPAIDFSQIAMIDYPYPSGSWWIHESRERAGFMATPGGRLLVLDGLKPSGQIRKLAPGDKAAAVRRPAVSYDGKKILFSMSIGAEKSSDKIYHLYEINVDGTGLRQLTSDSYHDIDPVYLPDGNIAFLTDRANAYGGCAPWATQHIMARCDSDGKNIYLLSVGSEGEYAPSVLNDGRLIYTRWEYNDKSLNRAQGLWSMNVDGTMSSAYWGTQSFYPDHLGEARAIPGTSQVAFCATGHHDRYAGSIGVVDNRQGMDAPDGLYKVTQDVRWAEGGDGPANVHPKPYCDDYHSSGKLKHAQYKSPYPLSEDLFLVSARTKYDNRPMGYYDWDTFHQPSLFKLYLMDKYGNHELIYSGTYNILHAQPVKSKTPPAVKPSMVQWPGEEKDGNPVASAVLYCGDVYEGMPKEIHGKAKHLRIIEAVQRTYTTGCVDGGGSPFGSTENEALDLWKKGGNPERKEVDIFDGDGAILAGPAIAILSNTRIKRVLGTVPISDDGSYYFNAPPGKAIYFQLLDEKKRVLQSMRSWVNLMPGERRGCVGCHEGRSNAPAKAFKFNTKPDEIKPPSWGVKTLSYVSDIQPIFEKNCAQCHMGQGKARENLDLTLRPDKHNRWGGIFPEPYITLTTKGASAGHYGVWINGVDYGMRETPKRTITSSIAGNFSIWSSSYRTLPPMTYWSYKSPLINMLMDGHNKVKLTDEEMDKLIAWVDTNCHFRGLNDILDIDDPDSDWFVFRTNPPKLGSAPYVNHLYKQDEFNSQADRPTLRETLKVSEDEEISARVNN